jgi:hypothetical protein
VSPLPCPALNAKVSMQFNVAVCEDTRVQRWLKRTAGRLPQ